MDTKIQETLSEVSDATLEKPFIITVDISPNSRLHKRLQDWGVLPKQRIFQLKPIYLGSMLKLSPLLLGIDLTLPKVKQELEGGSYLVMSYEAIQNHAEKMAKIIAIAIQNNNEDPDKSLVKFILRNFTAKEIMRVLTLVIKQMDIENFISTIISVKGLNVLESSKPANARSASGNEMSL